MDLTLVKGLGPARREKLEAAGVRTIQALARADAASLAEKAGLSEQVLDDFQAQARDIVALVELPGVGEAAMKRLLEADVRSLSDLASANVDDLAESTGLDKHQLGQWKREALPRAAVGKARDVVERTAKRASRELENARVVLREGIADARVMIDDKIVAEAKILPLKTKDNASRVLETVKGNVVILREKADTALVRIEGEISENLPIFKERAAELAEAAKGEVHEVRVRVQEIRDKRVLPEANKIREKVRGLFRRGGDSADAEDTAPKK